ncbi:MAG: type IV pili methyl-accepting chemotaxis transducer N-terminal domain-containing protein [Henriciella sp.]|nr:type IV pili methyl-accepting chemotaxis transducer N-terminal domain-containing protein [Henriciella sp.]
MIAALLSTTHIAASLALEANARNAELINMSGRQRMLSQRILFLSLQATDHNEDGVRDRLEQSIDLLTESQRALSTDPHLSQNLVDLYLGERDLNVRVYEFSEIAGQIALNPSLSEAALMQLLALDSEALLGDLNKAVSLFEAQAADDASRLELIQNASFYAALVILLLEGLLIFVPAQRVVRRSISNLETQSKIVTCAKVEAVKRNQELELLKDRVEHEAMHDSLTEFPNRRALESHMAKLKSLA